MPAAARKTDKDNQGHLITAHTANTVKINNLPAAVKSSQLNNGEMVAVGSSTVKIENMPAARKGDKTNAGHILLTGSSDVTIG